MSWLSDRFKVRSGRFKIRLSKSFYRDSRKLFQGVVDKAKQLVILLATSDMAGDEKKQFVIKELKRLFGEVLEICGDVAEDILDALVQKLYEEHVKNK